MNQEAPVRRIREDKPQEEAAPVPFSEAVIAESDDTTWVLVGDTWVDASRIITVGPYSNIQAIADLDEKDLAKTEEILKDQGHDGVAVQIDSPHPDTQFVISLTDSVEEIMGRVIDAQTDDEEDK